MFKFAEKSACPVLNVVLCEHLKKRVVSLAPLIQWHRERLPNRNRDAIGIVGINQQRLPAFTSRPSKARQDEDTRIIRILRRNILLSDEIHTIAKRGHEPDAGGTI